MELNYVINLSDIVVVVMNKIYLVDNKICIEMNYVNLDIYNFMVHLIIIYNGF